MMITTNNGIVTIDGEGASVQLGSNGINSDGTNIVITNFNFISDYVEPEIEIVKTDPIQDRFEILDL